MAQMRMGGRGLSDGIGEMLSSVRSRQPEMVVSARNAKVWREVAEPAAFEHTDAVYTVAGTAGSQVVVYVDANIWATELGLQAEFLRLKMNLKLSEGAGVGADPEPIKKLRFAASKEKYRGKRPCDVSVEKQLLDEGMHFEGDPVELSAEEEAEVEAACASIEDARLRKAAVDAMKAGLSLQKGQS